MGSVFGIGRPAGAALLALLVPASACTADGEVSGAGNLLSCSTGVTADSIYDYYGPDVLPDGTYGYPANSDTPELIARRWARQAAVSNPDWDAAAPPLATFSYDDSPEQATRVSIDFRTRRRVLVASLFLSRGEGSGWLLQGISSCARSAPPT